MTNTKHTPTPWKAELEGTLDIYGKNGECIATIHHAPQGSLKWERINDAEFIVRAVNSHEELLKVAKEMRRTLMMKEKPDQCYLDLYDKAIAKAEGK